MKLTDTQWAQILSSCGVDGKNTAAWAPIFSEGIDDNTFSAGDEEVASFVGHVLHESANLSALEESLYYKTPGQLMRTWPSRFATLEAETPFMRNPEALANKCYGGRMGNNRSGDGWRNRGSGLIQITGAANLKQVQEITGIPVYDYPELLRSPTKESLEVAVAWWEKNIPDSVIGNTVRETKVINAGLTGLSDRKEKIAKVQKALAKLFSAKEPVEKVYV